jgi:hypothetical protein
MNECVAAPFRIPGHDVSARRLGLPNEPTISSRPPIQRGWGGGFGFGFGWSYPYSYFDFSKILPAFSISISTSISTSSPGRYDKVLVP